jgi:hypothetical protein
MKKIKIMLLSLSILAVVGGALAFTVKIGNPFCVATTTSSTTCPTDCPDLAKIKTTTDPNVYLCTTTTSGIPGSECTSGTLCNGSPVNRVKE